MGKKLNSLTEYPKEGDLFGINLKSIKIFNIYRGFDEKGVYNRNIGLIEGDERLDDGLTICEYIGDRICVECLTGTKIQLSFEKNQYESEISYKNHKVQMNQDWIEMKEEYERIKEAPLSYSIELRNKSIFSNLYRIDDGFKFEFGEQEKKEMEIQSQISKLAKNSLNVMEICFKEISKDEYSIAYTDNVIFKYKSKKNN
ncbi:MAG: hypothetical protein HFJ12_04450 [Bacilli bacterium]|nr:hypothetical protein [Bacilli bacterium]